MKISKFTGSNQITTLYVVLEDNKVPYNITNTWVLFQDNWSALLCAAKEGYADICMELLEHGADIDHRDMVWYFHEVSDFISFLFYRC
jgi:hypothetical protein